MCVGVGGFLSIVNGELDVTHLSTTQTCTLSAQPYNTRYFLITSKNLKKTEGSLGHRTLLGAGLLCWLYWSQRTKTHARYVCIRMTSYEETLPGRNKRTEFQFGQTLIYLRISKDK